MLESWRPIGLLSACSVMLATLLCWGALDGIPHVQDEIVYTLQARVFAGGDRWAAESLSWFFWLESPSASAFPPGWPALLALGEAVGAGWLVNPLLAGALAPLTLRLVEPLRGRGTAVLAAALVSLSPGVLLLAASRMSHTSVLVALLLAAGVLVRDEGGWRRWGASAALGYVVLARPFDAALVGLPMLAVWSWRRQLSVWTLPTLAVVVLLFDNAYVTGDATTWPIDQWFVDRGFGDCNRLGFGERCMGRYTVMDAATHLWRGAVAFDRLLLGVPGGSVLVALGAWVWRRRALAVGLLVPLGYALYWSEGLAYGARYWHPLYVVVPAFTAVGLVRLVGLRRAPWVVVAASLWGLMGLRGLQDYWCVDDDLAALSGPVQVLTYGSRLNVDPLSGDDGVCSADLAMAEALLVPEVQVSMDPLSAGTIAVGDVHDDRWTLLDAAALEVADEDPDRRIAQAWALWLMGDEEAARRRLVGLGRPEHLMPLARLHFVMGEPHIARELVDLRLREEDPGDPDALLLLANIEEAEGDTAAGEAAYGRAEAAREDRRAHGVVLP